MAGFVGEYEYQLDEKGRVSLPAEYRRKSDNPRFVLLQWEPTHLTLFPEEVWEEVQLRFLEKRRGERQAAAMLRTVTRNAAEVEPDKQGRILLPGRLRDRLGLDGSVLLVGVIDRIELWNPTTFAELHPEDASADAEMAEMAHEIFG